MTLCFHTSVSCGTTEVHSVNIAACDVVKFYHNVKCLPLKVGQGYFFVLNF